MSRNTHAHVHNKSSEYLRNFKSFSDQILREVIKALCQIWFN